MAKQKLSKSEQIEHIENHLKLVHHEIRRYKRLFLNVDAQELESAAYFALFKATINFDKGKGLKFTTYLHKCIKNQVLQLLGKEDKTMLSLDKELGKDDKLVFIDMFSTTGGIEQIEHKLHLDYLLQFVNDRERKYLIEYYMNQEQQNEIAKRDGYSYQNIARIIQKAKEKIRKNVL